MMKTIRARMNKGEEEGFTLIELMVVVLILGILMAIAIPTFLSLTSSAKTNAAESDLTVASQDLATYYTQNGNYGTSQANLIGTTGANPTGLWAIDTGLNWATAMGNPGTKSVYVDWVSGTNVVIGDAAQGGNYYWVNDNQGTLTYAQSSSATVPSSFPSSSWSSLAG